MMCLKCGSETKNAKFCSHSCAAKFNNKVFIKRKAEKLKCRRCKKLFFRRELEGKSSCKPCREQVIEKKEIYKRKTIGELKSHYEKSGVHRSWWYSEIRQLARELNKHREKVCQICKYSIHVEYCHIKPISSFDDDATLEEINRESNVALLCPNHHYELDHDLLTLS